MQFHDTARKANRLRRRPGARPDLRAGYLAPNIRPPWDAKPPRSEPRKKSIKIPASAVDHLAGGRDGGGKGGWPSCQEIQSLTSS